MKKLKKPLHQRTFLIFILLDNGGQLYFYFSLLINGDFLPKKICRKKLKKMLEGRVDKTDLGNLD